MSHMTYRWAVVEGEVKEAVALGLPVLTAMEVQEQLFRAVLRCGHFNLVRKYISGGHQLSNQHLSYTVTCASQSTVNCIQGCYSCDMNMTIDSELHSSLLQNA